MLPLGLIKRSREYVQQFLPTMKLNDKNLELYAISPLGVDKKGYLSKRGEVNPDYQKRWFVLKGNLLFYFDKESDRKPNGVIILDSCTIELADSPEEPFSFLIVFCGEKSRNYVLAASSEENMQEWMRALTYASFTVTKSLVDTLQAKVEAARNRDRCLTEAGNKRISKLRPFSLLQVTNDKDTRAFTQPLPTTQPLRPPRKVKDQRGYNNSAFAEAKPKEETKASRVLPETSAGLPASTSKLGRQNRQSITTTESQKPLENFVPVDVYALTQSRSGGTLEHESESTFYTCLHYFTPPTVGEYLDKNDPLCEEEILDVPMKTTVCDTSEELESMSASLPKNGKIRSRFNQFSKSERRPLTRQTKFHTDVDVLTSKDDSHVGRSRSSFRSIHNSFGASIWVKVQNFESVVANMVKQSDLRIESQ